MNKAKTSIEKNDFVELDNDQNDPHWENFIFGGLSILDLKINLEEGIVKFKIMPNVNAFFRDIFPPFPPISAPYLLPPPTTEEDPLKLGNTSPSFRVRGQNEAT